MKSSLVSLALFLVPLVVSADVTISTITPSAGLTGGGEYVHIHGSNLLPTAVCLLPCPTTVKFGDASGTIVDNTLGEIVVLAPPHATGPVDVVVNVLGGSVTVPSGYFYQDPSPDDPVRLLLPVASSTFGSLHSFWETEVFVHNGNAEALVIAGASGPQGDAAHGNMPATIPPSSTVQITIDRAGNNGAFVYIPRRLIDNVVVSVRVHETSRDVDSWGTDIPVVPETQFRRTVILPGVPTDPRFRTLLRVYEYSVSDPGGIGVALRDDRTGELLSANSIRLESGDQVGATMPFTPAFGQLALDPILALFAAHSRIRVEVTQEGLDRPPIWGFVTVTNNATEQVTSISPAVLPAAVAIPASSTLAIGHWGGEGACVDVTAIEVTFSAGCALGVFPTPRIGSDGHFEVDGTFSTGVGPIASPTLPPAHFSGFLQGTSLVFGVQGINFGPVQLGSTAPCTAHPCP